MGLAADGEGRPLPLGPVKLAGVHVAGSAVSRRCLGVNVVEGEGGDQLPLPFGRGGVMENAAAGAMMVWHPANRRAGCGDEWLERG